MNIVRSLWDIMKVGPGVLIIWIACINPVNAEKRFDVAITVDDLPLQGPYASGPSRLDIAAAYLETLKAHGVTEAYGFVNAGKLEQAPDGAAVLDFWREAGYPLGNHGFTHMNLERAESLDAWVADMKANEPYIESRMTGQNWRVLRFPNLSAGGKSERHDGAIAWLTAHKYQVAEVTMSFHDWAYAEAYDRCRLKGDGETIMAMEQQYLRQVDEGILRTKALSQALYGRIIPQVLLTHLSGWSAHMLPLVMKRLDTAGATYVPLAQAQADKAYHEPGDDVGNGQMMERIAKRRGLDLTGLPTLSSTSNLSALCR
ncbi:polysaccharide deacetylase family protein [Asticcacaulis sp. W401b]|uniref:polysaccharide deacetylase family protein n=1 Tax=Asticcacaulis sp. W401b TaxID=3388666 RepID=UPI0039705076